MARLAVRLAAVAVTRAAVDRSCGLGSGPGAVDSSCGLRWQQGLTDAGPADSPFVQCLSDQPTTRTTHGGEMDHGEGIKQLQTLLQSLSLRRRDGSW